MRLIYWILIAIGAAILGAFLLDGMGILVGLIIVAIVFLIYLLRQR